ncbi:hypothetical protein SKAU_G00306450 [Synaphobranchus kaupii]|uniref:Uncharacterized protein n=1 Tax=Synaphobranchus kaupii TaxID=118154 RepID=A0A9Q1IJW1_SYNKA|nr:hypothetical protein SKAU_G00306450 [Synaphobranchus kaupii]
MTLWGNLEPGAGHMVHSQTPPPQRNASMTEPGMFRWLKSSKTEFEGKAVQTTTHQLGSESTVVSWMVMCLPMQRD